MWLYIMVSFNTLLTNSIKNLSQMINVIKLIIRRLILKCAWNQNKTFQLIKLIFLVIHILQFLIHIKAFGNCMHLQSKVKPYNDANCWCYSFISSLEPSAHVSSRQAAIFENLESSRHQCSLLIILLPLPALSLLIFFPSFFFPASHTM